MGQSCGVGRLARGCDMRHDARRRTHQGEAEGTELSQLVRLSSREYCTSLAESISNLNETQSHVKFGEHAPLFFGRRYVMVMVIVFKLAALIAVKCLG